MVPTVAANVCLFQTVRHVVTLPFSSNQSPGQPTNIVIISSNALINLNNNDDDHNHRPDPQMDQNLLKLLVAQTNNSLNESTSKLAQSIKTMLANMTQRTKTDTNNNNHNAQQTTQTVNNNNNNLEWPASFIQLLDALATKQHQRTPSICAQTHLAAQSTATSLSSISSLAIDDRDFELIQLEPAPVLAHDDHHLDEKRSLWLMDFDPNSAKPADAHDEHHDRNIMNLMKFVCKKSASTSNLQPQRTKPNHLKRTKSLPATLLLFNQITIIHLDDLNVEPTNNDDNPNQTKPKTLVECAPEHPEQRQPSTKQDFDEDESADEQERNDSHDKDEPKRSEENQQQSDNKQPVDGQQEQQSAQKDDGKHSMLQFALYNFRAAIEKYSLETRLSKSSQTAASQVSSQLEVGDTSTLRGSLKIIESLRGGNAGGPQQQHQQQTDDTNRSNRSKGAEWTWRELADMVKFTQTPIKRSLLRLPNDELDRRAVDCFSAIMQYMGDLPSASSSLQAPGKGAPGGEVECVYLILINCHNYPKLRDEIYCQLIKQTTNNRSAKQDSCLRGWRLFSIVAAYFDCSANLRPYLLKYLEQAAYDKRRAYHSIASVCLQNLRKTFKYKGRKNVPSIEEIAATSAGRNSKRQIYRLPGGTERVINTKSTTVVNDIIHEICSSMLNVQEADEMLEYSLYCIADGDLYTMPLNRDEYILDITTELIKNHQQYFLIFCRSIWHYPLRLDSKLYIEVIFNQIAPDYLEGLLLVLPGEPCDSERGTITSNSGSLRTGRPPTSGRSSATNLSQDYSQQRLQAPSNAPLRLRRHLVKEIARIAALLHRASGTDYIPHKDEIKYLLPKPIVTAIKQQQQRSHHQHESHHQQASSSSSVSSGSQSRLLQQAAVGADEPQQPQQKNRHQDTTVVTPSPQKWVELVQEQCREMSAFEALDAKAQFLDIVRHWPLFGSSFFAIKLIQRDLIQPMEFILALNKLGIQMLDIQTHETIHKYPFNEVVSTRKVRSEDGALFLDMKCGNLMKRTIIRIQTDQAHEISRLIRQYIDIDLLQTSKQVGSANNHLAASQSQ